MVRTAETQRRYRDANLEVVRANERRAAAKRTREDRLERQRLHRQRHPDRTRARDAVNKAISRGKLTRQPCHCGEVKVQAHHHRGYDVEHRLDVVWLCRKHHWEAHA